MNGPARPDRGGPIWPATGSSGLLGREPEVETAIGLLRDGARFVSICGRSGVGKTRLALEVARGVGDILAGGSVVVDVGALDSVDQFLASLAVALRVHVAAGATADEALRLHLASELVLIVADDADRTVGVADALAKLTAIVPSVRILATAHRPLDFPDERAIRLRELPVPAETDDLASIAASPAVGLFCLRAQAIDPTFELTERNAPLIAELCRRLDGLPLAIELAAARTRILPLARQLDVLERGGSLDLRVRAGSRRSAHYYRDVRGAIAATVDLTSDRERRLLRRLWVFETGCPLDALGPVCADPDDSEADILDAIASLVELDLVVPVVVADSVRYRMLQTIRDFAREELAAAGEGGVITDRHTAWYATYAAETRPSSDREQVRQLAAERSELSAALGRIVGGDDLVAGLSLAADIAPLWHEHGFFAEERGWLDGLLGRAADAGLEDEAHVRALYWSVLLTSWLRFDPDQRSMVIDRLGRASAMARSVASPLVRLFGLRIEALALVITHDIAMAIAAVGEGLAIATAIGDESWQARFEYLAGMAALQGGDVATAAALGGRSFEHGRRRHDTVSMLYAGILLNSLPAGTPGVPQPLPDEVSLLELAREDENAEAELILVARLSGLVARRGQPRAAAEYAIDGLTMIRRTGAWGMAAFIDMTLAVLAISRGEFEQAARFHGMVLPVLEETRYGMTPERRQEYLAKVDEVRDRLGAERFDALVAGMAVRLPEARVDEALAYARTIAPPQADDSGRPKLSGQLDAPPDEPLTAREVDVLRVMATGATNREIGQELGLRPKTVMHYSMSIYAKLGVRTRAGATAWAHQHGLAGEAAST